MRKYKNVTSMLPVEPLSNVIALNSLFFQASSREGTKTEVINAAVYFFLLLSPWVKPVKTSHKKRNQLRWTDG